MTRVAAVVLIETDDSHLLTGTADQQWQSVMTAIASGGIAGVCAVLDERDAAALLIAFDAFKAHIGEPIAHVSVPLSPRRH
jgi:hypothetical protein